MTHKFYTASIFKLVIAAALLLPAGMQAQTTLSMVKQLMQTHCNGYGCHDGGTPIFNVNLSDSAFYDAVVNVTPVNPRAVTRENKLVIPGDVARSFLLRKMAHGISSALDIDAQEGALMPQNLPKLADKDIELVRQWILAGAPETGNVVDTAMINEFYRGKGVSDSYGPHNAPPAGQGMQIYLGKIFIPAHTETEIFCKYDPHFSTPIEVKRLESMMPSVTHHHVLYNFLPGQDALYRAGVRPLAENSMASVTTGIGSGPGLWDYVLPPGTAYYFAANSMFDMNLHIRNPLQDSILGVDLYINIYTQPVGTAQHYMIVKNFVNEQISIPQDNQSHMFSQVCTDSFATKTWRIWQMYSHTHRYGTGYDLWLRNSDGSKGEKIYDGNYSYETQQAVGYYRWGVHSTIRYWPMTGEANLDSLFEVDPRLGFIGEATFKNTAGPNPVTWGLTSDEEMMVSGIQYIAGNSITGISNTEATNSLMAIYPNPARGEFNIACVLDKPETVRIELVNMVGEKLGTLVDGQLSTGNFSQNFKTARYNMAAGIYFIRTTVNNVTNTDKLIITE